MLNKIKWASKLIAYRWHAAVADQAERLYFKTGKTIFQDESLRHSVRAIWLYLEAMGYLAEFADKASSTKEDAPT